MRDFCGFSSSEAMKPSSSSFNFYVAPNESSRDTTAANDDDTFLYRSRGRIHRGLVHVAVANAGDDDALGAVL